MRCDATSTSCSTSRGEWPGGRGLLDTNAVIRFTEIEDDRLPAIPLLSTVTLAELTVGSLLAADERTWARRQEHLQLAEDVFDALPVDAAVARAFGRVSAAVRAAAASRCHARSTA